MPNSDIKKYKKQSERISRIGVGSELAEEDGRSNHEFESSPSIQNIK